MVNVRGGTEDFSESLTFNAADSGRNGRFVTWRAASLGVAPAPVTPG